MHLHFFVVPPTVIIPSQHSLLYYILAPLQHLPSLFISLIYHIIVIVQALRFNYLLNNYRLFPNANYIVAMCYILLSALFPAWANINEVLIINFFIIFTLHTFLRLLNTQQPIRTILNCGLLTGTTVLLYPPIAIMMVSGFIAILIIRSFRLNEIISYLLGVIIPYYFLGAILFLNNQLPQIKHFLPSINFHVPAPKDKISFIIASTAIIITTLAGFISLQNHISKLVISARKLWIIIVSFFVMLSASLLITTATDWTASLLAVTISASAIAANTFNYSKRTLLVAILFWMLLIAVLFNSFEIINIVHK